MLVSWLKPRRSAWREVRFPSSGRDTRQLIVIERELRESAEVAKLPRDTGDLVAANSSVWREVKVAQLRWDAG